MRMSPCRVWTARVSYGASDRLDITAAGKDPIGGVFAPDWSLLGPALAKRRKAAAMRSSGQFDAAGALDTATWEAYVIGYREQLARRLTERDFALVLGRDRVTLVCYCVEPQMCHRTVLAEELCRRGAIYEGERRPEKCRAHNQLELFR